MCERGELKMTVKCIAITTMLHTRRLGGQSGITWCAHQSTKRSRNDHNMTTDSTGRAKHRRGAQTLQP